MTPVRYDPVTGKWFTNHQGREIIFLRCEVCGKFYKPILGHICRKGEENVKPRRNKKLP